MFKHWSLIMGYSNICFVVHISASCTRQCATAANVTDGSRRVLGFLPSPLLLLYYLVPWLYLDHFVDVALRACELCRVFDFDEDNEVEVVPHVVLGPDVLLERHVLVVERLSLQTCFRPQQDWLVPVLLL